MMSIETMLGATVEELRAIADDESLSGAYKDSLYTAADWVVAAIDRITSLEKDNQEQCRLNAMGAERESRLMARVKELEKDAERFKTIAAHMTFKLDGECVTMDFSRPVDATKTHDIHKDWLEPMFTDSVRKTVDTAMQKD